MTTLDQESKRQDATIILNTVITSGLGTLADLGLDLALPGHIQDVVVYSAAGLFSAAVVYIAKETKFSVLYDLLTAQKKNTELQKRIAELESAPAPAEPAL